MSNVCLMSDAGCPCPVSVTGSTKTRDPNPNDQRNLRRSSEGSTVPVDRTVEAF